MNEQNNYNNTGNNFSEMEKILEFTAKVNRSVTLPFLQKKTGLNIVSKGLDHGMIVTEADLNVSRKLLSEGIEGFDGLRKQYSGSFSEEDDDPNRLSGLEIFQVDPIDGTGDMVDTYQSKKVTSPTTLISKLSRYNISEPFKPTAGLIFDVLHEFGIISDGKDIGLYKFNSEGKLSSIKYELMQPSWKDGDIVKINRRISYPQLSFDGPFMNYLKNSGLNIEVVPSGGAGIFAMQVFRNYLESVDDTGKEFNDLKPLTIGFNAQPDWKTWDTDPTEVIAYALGMPKRTNIYGDKLDANVANLTLKDMHHTKGYVLSTSGYLSSIISSHARAFEERNIDCHLLKKDYEYSKAIIAHVK